MTFVNHPVFDYSPTSTGLAERQCFDIFCLFSVHSAGEAGVGPQSPAEEESDIGRLHPRLDGVCPRAGDRQHPALCREGRLPPARELPQTQER